MDDPDSGIFYRRPDGTLGPCTLDVRCQECGKVIGFEDAFTGMGLQIAHDSCEGSEQQPAPENTP